MKPAPFAYARPRTLDAAIGCSRAAAMARSPCAGSAVARADAQPAAGAARAARRPARHLPELRGGRDESAMPCSHRRRAPRMPRSRTARVPDPTGGLMPAVAARHRLSRGAQPRHDRRQPGACRSGRRLGRRAAGCSARAIVAVGPAASGGSARRAFVTRRLRDRARRRTRCSRRARAELSARGALGPLEVLPQARRVRQGDRRGVVDDPERGAARACSARSATRRTSSLIADAPFAAGVDPAAADAALDAAGARGRLRAPGPPRRADARGGASARGPAREEDASRSP